MRPPRPVILALVGAALIAAVFVFTRSDGEATSQVPSAPTPGAAPDADVPARGAERTSSPRQTRNSQARGQTPRREGVPQRVRSALSDGDVVVIALFQSGGSDDAATRARLQQVVRRLGGEVTVVTDSVGHLDRYAAVVGPLGITQVPAIVVVAPDREARLVQGFVDRRSLRQLIADALR